MYTEQIEEANKEFSANYKTLADNSVYRNAVSMCLFQIGELSVKLSDSFRDSTADEIPWKQIRGLRNIIAHDYGSVDNEYIWETITEDIPVLKKFCERHLYECEDLR